MVRKINLFFIVILLLSSCLNHNEEGVEKLNASFLTSSASYNKLTENELLMSADNAFNNGNKNKAYGMYAQLLSKNPFNIHYLSRLGEIERVYGNLDKARSRYDAILEIDGENIAAVEGVATICLMRGDFNCSIALLTEIVSDNGEYWQAYDSLGTAYSLVGNFDSALESYKHALKISINNPRVMNNMALLEILSGHTKKAINILISASKIDDVPHRNKVQIDLNLAFAYALESRLDEAEQVASQHLKGKELYNNMGVYAILAKDKKIANSFLQKSLISSVSYYDKAWKNLESLKK